MKDIYLNINKEVDISNSMVLLGFPTVGLIGSISGNYIANTLNLEQIGSIHSKHFHPTAIIRNGKPVQQVRIYYGGDDICKGNNECDHLIVIVGDLPIHSSIIYSMIEEILQWTDKGNISCFLGLEGIKSDNKKEGEVDVYGVGTTQKMIDLLDQYDIEQTKDGIITGLSGALLAFLEEKNQDMLCILTEAHVMYPDSRAAGRLLEKIDKMLPGVDLDLAPLYDEAEKIETKIKEYMKQSKDFSQFPQTNIPHMYQ